MLFRSNISFLRQLLCIDVLVGGGFLDFASSEDDHAVLIPRLMCIRYLV